MIGTYIDDRKDIYEEIIRKYKTGNHTKFTLHTLAGYKYADVNVAFRLMKEKEL